MLTQVCAFIQSRAKSNRGQTLVEYGLILALVSIVVIAVLGLLGGQITTVFQSITDTLGGAVPAPAP